jgi:hypothetical protein
MQNKTIDVMDNSPVRLYNGRFVFRQCKSRLKWRPPEIREVSTVNDVIGRLQRSLELIKLVGGR